MSTTAANAPLTAEGTAVAIEGRDTCERSNLPTRERAELRQIADQSAGDGRADARHRSEQIAFMAPGGVLFDRVADELFKRLDLAIECFDDAIDAGLKSVGHHTAAILLDGAKRSELPTAHDQVFDALRVSIDGGASSGLQRGGKAGDEACIDGVGFGELARGFGEAAHFQRRDDDDGQASGDGCADEGMLEPAGSFDDDALEAVAGEALDKRSDRGLVVGDAKREVSFEQIEVEGVLADIDADVDRGNLLWSWLLRLAKFGLVGPIRLFEMS